MPRTPKPPERRQRSNKPKSLEAQIIEINNGRALPEPPKKIAAELQAEWKALWRSDLASTWVVPNDLPGLTRLFELRHQEATYRHVGSQETLLQSKQGALQLHPLLKEARSIRAEVVALEDRYGLSPLARLKLGIALGEAAVSLDDMNARFLTPVTKSDDENADSDEPLRNKPDGMAASMLPHHSRPDPRVIQRSD